MYTDTTFFEGHVLPVECAIRPFYICQGTEDLLGYAKLQDEKHMNKGQT